MDIKKLLKKIDERKQELDKHRPLNKDVLNSLRREIILNWTYNSNAIEGNTLDLAETKVIIEDGLTIGGKSIYEHLEAINHKNAICMVEAMVNSEEELNTWNIKNIHQLVLKGIKNNIAGKYRNINVVISGASHIPPDYLHVNEQMLALEKWYKTVAQKLHPIERAAHLHTKFVGIHPFEDGNGRTARLLLNFELLKNGYPPAIIENKHRKDYYVTLDAFCAKNQTEPFTKMVAMCVAKNLDFYLKIININPTAKTA